MEEMKSFSTIDERSGGEGRAIELIKDKMGRMEHQLAQSVSKAVYKKEMAQVKEEVSQEIEGLVHKFTKLIKKYTESAERVSPVKSVSVSADKPTVRHIVGRVGVGESE